MKYRPDIDGLRAIAVLSVILYHMQVAVGERLLLQGGFLGVDVFFVISGYLITSILLHDLDNGVFSLRSFYERRARRILPALSLIVALSIVVAWFKLDGEQMVEFGHSLMAMTVFLSNVLFYSEGGYFGLSAELKPHLHTWSLAIEEQFYVIFPLLLLLCWKYAKRYIEAVFLLCIVVSLPLITGFTEDNRDAGFYLIHTRFWELLAGALLAKFTFNRKFEFDRSYDVIQLIGLGMIMYSVVFFSHLTLHPSYNTLIPVVGTLMVIGVPNRTSIVSAVLSTRVLVGVGLISYSLYLWHFPILAFARLSNLGELPDHIYYWFLPVILVLSFLSWKYIEMPCRKKDALGSAAFFKIIGGVWVIIFCSGLALHLLDGVPTRLYPESVLKSLHRDDNHYLGQDGKLCSDIVGAHHKGEDWFCELTDRKDKDIDFFLFGDSHAYTSLPAFRDYANKFGLRGVSVSDSACIPLLDVKILRDDQDETDCMKLNDRVYNFVKEKKIKTIFLVSRWTFYTEYKVGIVDALSYVIAQATIDRYRLVRMALERTVARYAQLGTKIVLVGQVPMQHYSPREIYKNAYLQPDTKYEYIYNHSVSKHDHKKLQTINTMIFNYFNSLPQYVFLDPTHYFCPNEKCLMGSAEESYYYDLDHISYVGNKKFLDMLVDSRRYIID